MNFVKLIGLLVIIFAFAGCDMLSEISIPLDNTLQQPPTDVPPVEQPPTDEPPVDEPPVNKPVLPGFTEAIVTRVIDGDTVELSTGERVRFIAVDTPERGEQGFTEATDFTAYHVLNQTVWLEVDGNEEDRFGRLRRYVWLQMPTDPTDEQQIINYMLNALLIINGHAVPHMTRDARNGDLFNRLLEY